MMISIREAREGDLEAVLSVGRVAVGGDIEANLVNALVEDTSAQTCLSLLAFEDDRAVGHILFTRAWLRPEAKVALSILTPLAVVPDFQSCGIGGRLIYHCQPNG